MRSAAVPSEVRALTVLDTVPAGCRAMPVPNDYNAPHLRQDEIAIVDPADCALVHGELFVVACGAGPAIMQVRWRTTGNLSAWWCGSLDDPKSWAECEAWINAGRVLRMADGPYRPGGLEERTLGRVVGILQPEPAQVHYGR